MGERGRTGLLKLTNSESPGIQKVAGPRLSADVLVPDVRMTRDPRTQHLDALGRGEVDDLYAVFPEPVETAGEVDRLAEDHPADAELPDEAAAVPARSERRHHRLVAVTALAARLAERVDLAVDRRVVFLDAPVVPAAEQSSAPVEERGADRDAALREPQPGLLDRNDKWLRRRFEEMGVIQFEDWEDTGEEYLKFELGEDVPAAV